MSPSPLPSQRPPLSLAPAADAPLHALSAVEIAGRIAAGSLRALDVTEAHIARLERLGPRLGALAWTRFDEARREARAIDERRAAGEPLGPLAGVPVTIKECLDLAGSPSTFGLLSRRDHRAAEDERHVARLRQAGAVVLAKTNVAQVLLYYETDNPLHGRASNPWSLDRSPGGSSGGEAAAIASGGSALGLGTDIGGSVRVPAAFCGLCSMKPSAGRMPDEGTGSVPRGQRIIQSQVGVLARTVADVALGLQVASASGTPAAEPVPALGDPGAVDLSRLRIGLWREDGVFAPGRGPRRALELAAEILRRRGATVVELAPPSPAEGLGLFYRTFAADRFVGIARTLGRDPVDPRLKPLLLAARSPAWVRALIAFGLARSGRRRTAALVRSFGPFTVDAYFQAVEAILDYRARWLRALDLAAGGPLDLVLSVASPLPAIRHGDAAELSVMGSWFAIYNVLGWPAGVVPVTRVREDEQQPLERGDDVMDWTAAACERGSVGLPLGVQVAARPFQEHLALAALGAIEAARAGEPDYPRVTALPE